MKKKEIGGKPYFTLNFPNISVRSSFYDILCSFLSPNNKNTTRLAINKALEKADFKLLEEAIRILFAIIPYQYNPVKGDKKRISDYEGYYSSLLFYHLKATDVYKEGESSSYHGRLDIYVRAVNYLYIFEFKIGKSDALNQILDRKYYEKYLGDEKRNLNLVGVNFDAEDKNISKLEYKEIKNKTN